MKSDHYHLWMRLRLALVIALAWLLGACGTSAVTPEQLTTAQQLLNGVNAARAKGTTCGNTFYAPVSRLSLDLLLVQAAQAHSEDMLARGVLSHTGADGSNPGQRIARTGYKAATWGENAAAGYGSPDSVVKGWLNSPGHCWNIMNPAFTELGGARAGNYWTLVLARPAPTR